MIVSTSILFSCNIKEETLSEKEIMRQVLPNVLDSMVIKLYVMHLPIPKNDLFDSVSGKMLTHTNEKHSYVYRNIERKLRLGKEDLHVLVVLNDTVHEISSYDYDVNTYYHFLPEMPDNKMYTIDWQIAMENKGYQAQLTSESDASFATDLIIFKTLSISRIAFNRAFTKGVFTCEYNCGLLCGYGYLMHISMQNNTWSITSIDFNWIS